MGGREKISFCLGRKKALMLDYLRLSPMIGGVSLSLKSNGREQPKEKEGESGTKSYACHLWRSPGTNKRV